MPPMKSAFWNDPNVQVKRAYRWLVNFSVVDQWLAKKVTLPSYTMSETKHAFLNHTFFYPGRVEWQTIDITFVDPGTPDTTAALLNTLQASGYELPTNPESPYGGTLSKKMAALRAGLGSLTIQQINDLGNPVSTWGLKNAWLKDLKLSELSYESDDITDITATIRYDYATYQVHGPGGASPWGGGNGEKRSPSKGFGAGLPF